MGLVVFAHTLCQDLSPVERPPPPPPSSSQYTFLPRALIFDFWTGAKCFYVILFVKNFGGLQGNLLGGILGSGRLVKSEPGEKWQWVVLLK